MPDDRSDHAPAASPPVASSPVTLLWSATGGADGMSFPNDMAIAPDGRLWVADTGNDRFDIFEPDGTFVESWGSSGAADGQFALRRANGDGHGAIAFAPDGSFYALDVGNRRVRHFASDRSFLGGWGGFGQGPGQYVDPVGLDVGTDGTVYVLDDARDVIESYGADGAVLRALDARPDGAGGANTANGMTVDAHVNVFVTFCCGAGNHVAKLDPNGVVSWTEPPVGQLGFADQPSGIAVDQAGHVFVTVGHVVRVFDADGNQVAQWGDAGPGSDQLVFPFGIIRGGLEDVYVADADANQVKKFELLPPLAP
jgi:sugar lactone lactonase YvrE